MKKPRAAAIPRRARNRRGTPAARPTIKPV